MQYRFRGHSLITMQILDTVYVALCTLNRSLDFADFVSRHVRYSFRIYAEYEEHVAELSYRSSSFPSTVIAATVIVARRVEWNFAICNRVSRRKLVEENFVEFVRRGVSRFLNVSANCSHNRYLRSRNIEQRLHNKHANGKLHNYSAFLDPPCLLLIRKSMALHFAPYITLIRAALICRLTDFSIGLLFRATCNVHPSPRVFRVYQRVVTCGQRATREII